MKPLEERKSNVFNCRLEPPVAIKFRNHCVKQGKKMSEVFKGLVLAYNAMMDEAQGRIIHTLEFKGVDKTASPPKSEVTPISPKFQRVKIFGLALANTLADPPCDLPPENEYDLPEILWPANGHRIAAFRVEDNSMSPKYTHGNTVVCDCDAEVMNGNAVVIKFDDRVVIKRFKRTGDTIQLKSENPKGRSYKIHIKEVKWMLKVIGYFAKD